MILIIMIKNNKRTDKQMVKVIKKKVKLLVKRKKKTVKKKTNKVVEPNPVGRPPLYNDPKVMQDKITEYFKNPPRKRKLFSNGLIVGEIPVVTISGLVLYLGFCDRAAFYDYEAKPEFCHTIKRARTFIEQDYEECLRQGSCTGAIFALKNFGWTDRQEIDLGGQKGSPVEIIDTSNLSAEEVAKLLQERLNQ